VLQNQTKRASSSLSFESNGLSLESNVHIGKISY